MIVQLSSRASSDEVNGVTKRAITIITNSGTPDSIIEGANATIKARVSRKSNSREE